MAIHIFRGRKERNMDSKDKEDAIEGQNKEDSEGITTSHANTTVSENIKQELEDTRLMLSVLKLYIPKSAKIWRTNTGLMLWQRHEQVVGVDRVHHILKKKDDEMGYDTVLKHVKKFNLVINPETHNPNDRFFLLYEAVPPVNTSAVEIYFNRVLFQYNLAGTVKLKKDGVYFAYNCEMVNKFNNTADKNNYHHKIGVIKGTPYNMMILFLPLFFSFVSPVDGRGRR